jgi:hypothetical protein
MRGRCQCGGAITYAHEDLGCLECGEVCCPGCAFRPEGHVFCPSCASRVFARFKEPALPRAVLGVRPAGEPRPVPARPTAPPASLLL